MKLVSKMNRVSIKQPIRKIWKFSNGSLLVSIPKELGLREGDFVRFRILGDKIFIERLDEDFEKIKSEG